MRTATKIQLAATLFRVISTVRGLFGANDFVQVVRKGLRWDLDLSEGIDLAIFAFGQFENGTAKALAGLIGPGAIVLDIGANVGAHTLPLAHLVGSKGKVYAFEPTQYAFRKLTHNLALNPELINRVVAEQIRLTRPGANDPGQIYSSWKVVGEEPRHQKHLGIAKSTEGARSVTLDEYWKNTGLQKLDFIKLDVDGFEVEVLKGGINTLKLFHPPICLELSPYVLEERGTSIEELLSKLHESGYQLVDLRNRSSITNPDGSLRAEIPDGSGINALALPKDQLVRAAL
jgi:FkbM family methyltransferase